MWHVPDFDACVWNNDESSSNGIKMLIVVVFLSYLVAFLEISFLHA